MRLNIRLDLTSEPVRDRLLDGLDQWVRLGLLTDEQVRALADIMSEPVRTAQSTALQSVEPGVERSVEPGLNLGLEPRAALPPYVRPHSDFLAEDPAQPQSKRTPKDRKVAKALRALLEEFSVIWLLFLGVFLVVVSSGVLAASQWQSFSSVGQYAILLAYTLLFWGASLWTGGQVRLQATAKMLSLTTLLLIPINFWMMDALGVMSSAVGFGVGLLAALLLSFIACKVLEGSHRVNFVGLGWLHLGWVSGGWMAGGGWPVIATYLGTVGTAVNLTYQDNKAGQTEDSLAAKLLSFDAVAAALSVVILLFRSLFIAQIPPSQLGLAAGICGWLLVRLTRGKTKNPQLWSLAGGGLLFAGWAVNVTQPQPWQAIAISALALWLIWDALKRDWQPAQLFGLIAISAQAYWLFGALIPSSTRDTALSRLSAQLSPQSVEYYEWLSLGFLPFLVGMLLFAGVLRGWDKKALAVDTEWLALGLGACLTLLSLTNNFTLAANVSLSAIISAAALRRKASSIGLVTLTHLLGLGAIAAILNYFAPALSEWAWALVALGGAIAELTLHLTLRHPHWRLNTWQVGVALSALGYWLLMLCSEWQASVWAWITIPIALTVVANHKRSLRPKETAALALAALFAHTFWLISPGPMWFPVIFSFTLGTLCAAANSRILKTTLAAAFTVGSALVAIAATILWFYSDNAGISLPEGQLLLYWPATICGLWLWRRRLSRRADELSTNYQKAALLWSLVTLAVFLLYGTCLSAFALSPEYSVGWLGVGIHEYTIASFILLSAVLLEAIYHKPAEWRYWSLAWTTEIVLILALAYQGAGIREMAIATLALGLSAQIAGDLWTLKRPPYRASWHGIPMAFAGLGLAMGHSAFVQDSGLFTIFAGAIAIAVGRRQPSLNPLSYIGLFALSVGAYELLIYRMLQASGGQAGDGFTLLALLGIAIACAHRLFSRWLLRYLQIPTAALQRIAHTHWLVGTGFAAFATVASLSQPKGIALWTGTGILLAAYALATGNHKLTPTLSAIARPTSAITPPTDGDLLSGYTVWTSLGIAQALLIALHNRIVWFPDRMFLITWGGIAACLLSLLLSRIRWSALGWPPKPWDVLALWFPLSVLGAAITYRVPTQTLLIVGAFYAWMAKSRSAQSPGQVRLSYISLGLVNWTIMRYLDSQGWLSLLAISILVGLSILYFTEMEPSLQGAPTRQQRHWLRILASALIGLTALYQTEIYTPTLVYAAITLVLCTLLIFAGLGLKVRAFLYVGTTTFILQVVRVLWLFISANSLLLWAVGIVLGMLFIWIAATFESRRTQVMGRLETWSASLQRWE